MGLTPEMVRKIDGILSYQLPEPLARRDAIST